MPPQHPIPLEDFREDIVGKAMRGLSLSDDALSDASGVPVSAIQRIRRGDCDDEEALARIAPCLNLDPGSLVASARKAWYPEARSVEGLAMFNTPYHDMRVNAYLIWDAQTRHAAIFDTGTDVSGLNSTIEAENLEVKALFLTHTHPDHIAEVDTLKKHWPSLPVYANRAEPHPDAESFDAGESFDIGALHIETRQTSGHSAGGTSYVVTGLARPVAVVGDALFAGSMGGGMVSFDEALDTNRRHLFTLPEETIVCPGHGPLTTIAEEKAHNPFYPEFKS